MAVDWVNNPLDGVIPYVRVAPVDTLAVLSRGEIQALCHAQGSRVQELLRRCALAVLSSGLEIDDARILFERYRDFQIEIVQENQGVRLELRNAPSGAFVDGRIIHGVREQLFAVLRDLIYVNPAFDSSARFDLTSSAGITDAVFRILRNAAVFGPSATRGLAVCWGGHAINRVEYDFTKEVGYALGLRGLDVCTGCGPGAMKGPMKGAIVAHAKQRISDGRYVGISEPGIIAAEAPNPIVNRLVIMPDMEKRLEAFVRLAHAIVIFPGGVGTTEELLYLLGLLAAPENAAQRLPVFMTGPRESAAYFAALDTFVREVLGEQSAGRYRIMVGEPHAVADAMGRAVEQVQRARDANDDARDFNWGMQVAGVYQEPFAPTHATLAQLEVARDMPVVTLAGHLRRLFSGLVAGNVKESGISQIEAHGPFRIHGDVSILNAVDALLRQFIQQGRMRIAAEDYRPCYEIVA